MNVFPTVPDAFRENLLQYLGEMNERVVTEQGDWTVKGFIDVYQRIYTISLDTKVLSKVLELLLFPVIARFADDHGYEIVPARAQNQYPDISFVSRTNANVCYALDVKSTYRKGHDQFGNMRVSGMTLGTFSGYFRLRDRPLSSTFAYQRYQKHYILGVIYSRVQEVDEHTVHTIEDLSHIPSVANHFDFFLHEKYRIASDQPGSSNTENIGSTHLQDRLLNGTGVFAALGVEIFDDYWVNYQTRAMAREHGLAAPPYRNLIEYRRYKGQGRAILAVPEEQLQTEADIIADDDEIPTEE